MFEGHSLALILSLTVALLVGGIPVLSGATYLVAAGDIPFQLVFILAVVTTLIWDTVWYVLGRVMPVERIRAHWFFKRNERAWDAILRAYEKRQRLFLFFSRFAYGTNNIAAIASGFYRLPYGIFVVISAASIVVWFFVLIYFSRFLYHYIGAESYPFSLVIAVVVFLVLVWAGRYGAKRLLDRYLIS